MDNERGFSVPSSRNTVVRNSSHGNILNYDLDNGNVAGPIGPAAGATNPWANISN